MNDSALHQSHDEPEVYVRGYWEHETSGDLRPIVQKYLDGFYLTPKEISRIRRYLREQIFSPAYSGREVAELRLSLSAVTDSRRLHEWVDRAELAGAGPF